MTISAFGSHSIESLTFEVVQNLLGLVLAGVGEGIWKKEESCIIIFSHEMNDLWGIVGVRNVPLSCLFR